jgi:hypothetical protein
MLRARALEHVIGRLDREKAISGHSPGIRDTAEKAQPRPMKSSMNTADRPIAAA